MSIRKSFFLVSMLAILSACATAPRQDAAGPAASRTPAPAPIKVDAEPPPVTVAKPAEVIEPSPGIAAPVAPVAAEKPARPIVAKPAKPAGAAKLVKPATAVKERVAAPAPPKAPVPIVAAAVSTPPGVEPAEALAVAAGHSNRIVGKLELIAGSGQSLSAEEMHQAVVYFVPDKGAHKANPGRYRIYTHNKEFEPSSMVIPLGSTISFPNQDEILHNVFSVTPQSSFDLGVYGEGKSAEYTFKKTGLVLINCNVHEGMQANVLVVDSPYIAAVDDQGAFRLADVPTGAGKLMVWHPRANVQEQAVTVPLTAPVSLHLVLSKPRIAAHLNKERKSY